MAKNNGKVYRRLDRPQIVELEFVGELGEDGRPKVDTTDYSRQDAWLETTDPHGALTIETWRLMAASLAIACQDYRAEIEALKKRLAGAVEVAPE